MSSWQLLRTLFFAPIHNAIYQREQRYPPLWNQVPQGVRNLLSVMMILFPLLYIAGLVYAPRLYTTACFCLPILFLVLPSLLPWALPLSIALAPTIAREREQGTWETLRLAPLGTETLVLEKAAGALWRIRYILRRLGIILVIASVGMGVLGSLAIYRLNVFPLISSVWIIIISTVVGMIIFLVDRAQQFALMIASALAGSSISTAVRAAISSTLLAALLMWFFDVSIAALVLTLFGESPIYLALSDRFLMLFTFGSAGAYLLELHPLWAALAISATFLLREFLLRGLWHLTLRAAERL